MKPDITIDISMPGHTRHLRLISRICEKLAEEIGTTDDSRKASSYLFSVVLTEGVVNAIKHACSAESNNEIRIRITFSNDTIVIKVYDNGIGFDLDAIPAPSFASPALTDKGRGIFILRSLMDTVTYLRSHEGNVLEMRKKLCGDQISRTTGPHHDS